MLQKKQIDVSGYEEVVEFVDADFHAFMAIYSTVLGPALGGIRLRTFDSHEEALSEVLELAKAMTYKAAVTDAGLGGAKCVVLVDRSMTKEKKHQILLSIAEMLNQLKGRFIGAGDMGLDAAEMEVIKGYTPFVAGVQGESSSGDPSPFTAYGVFQAMKAVAGLLWGDNSLKGKTIAIQGIGKVSMYLIDHLFWEGAHLIIGTRDEKRAETIRHQYQAQITSAEEILRIKCDIFSPCAVGGIINDETVPQLHCNAIVGAANNQLNREGLDVALKRREILYIPDFVANAGGIINIAEEISTGKYQALEARKKTEKIFAIVENICLRSFREDKTPLSIAMQLAEENLSRAIQKRNSDFNY